MISHKIFNRSASLRLAGFTAAVVAFALLTPTSASRGLSQMVGILPTVPEEKEIMWETPKGVDLKDQSVSRELIIRLRKGDGVIDSKNDVDAKAARTLTRVTSLAGVQNVEVLSERQSIHKVTLDKSAKMDEVLVKITKWKNVVAAEPNFLVQMDDYAPNDPRFTNGDLYGIEKIRAPETWDNSTGSKDVVVCVIDTGVDYSHPDLADNMWRNPGESGLDSNGNDKSTNGIDDDGNGVIDDVYGLNAITGSGDPMDDNSHGTHCAGTIGAVGNNGIGVIGVSPSVSIMACKFLSASGSGSISDAIRCVEYALNMGATLTSNSWGGGGASAIFSSLLDIAQQRDQLFVAAAGNSGTDNDVRPHFPSSYSQDIVVSVASTTSADTKSGFSCYGLTSVDLGAPGSSILSTIPGDRYASYSGTSMATPHVAGAFALLLAAYPGTSASELKRVVMATGEPIADLQGRTVSGKRMDVKAAFDCLETGCDLPTPAPTVPPPPPPGEQPTQFFSGSNFDLSNSLVTFFPTETSDGTVDFITCMESNVTEYPVSPAGGTQLSLGDDAAAEIQLGFDFPFFGYEFSSAYIGSNGYVTFGSGDTTWGASVSAHFSRLRISPLFTDLTPDGNSVISWKAQDGTMTVTWDNIMQYGAATNRQSFQLTMQSDGQISVMYKGPVTTTQSKVVGVSGGEEPDPFVNADLSATPCNSEPVPPTSPTSAPTSAPTPAPTTSAPTPAPTTSAPTPAPTTASPTSAPTPAPTTASPTSAPTPAPSTSAPTPAPTTSAPTPAPTTASPTSAPTPAPTTMAPTSAPTPAPTTSAPTPSPTTSSPTSAPTPEPIIEVSYFGCYVDNGARAFSKYAGVLDMEACAAAALAEDSDKFAMQWPQGGGGETAQCFIHDKGLLAETGTYSKRPDRECKGESWWNPTYNGQTFEFNGNGWRNAVYKIRDTSLPTPEPTTSAPTPEPTESTIEVSYFGCYVDNYARAFSKYAGVLDMEACAAAALAEDSDKFAMQWPQGGGGETAQCFIHDKGLLAETGTYSKRSDSECKGEWWNPTYNGQTFEFNGNGWRNAVYTIRNTA